MTYVDGDGSLSGPHDSCVEGIHVLIRPSMGGDGSLSVYTSLL